MKPSLFLLLFLFSIQLFSQAPNFDWAKRFGGPLSDVGLSSVTDQSGNIYFTGYFSDTADFDSGSNTFNLSSQGVGDVFISKYNSQGNFIWTKRIGSSGEDKGFSIKIDSKGYIYTMGSFEDIVDFDPGASVFNLNSFGDLDLFILKLDSTGNFVWAKNMGGVSSRVEPFDMKIDKFNNIYTTGLFDNTIDFDPNANTFNLSSSGSTAVFVSKINESGNFVFAKKIDGNSLNEGRSISLDSIGNIYLTGSFNGTTDFDPGITTYSLTSTGSQDIFVCKLDSLGNFVWANAFGSAYSDAGIRISTDTANNICVTGRFNGTIDFDPSAGVNNLTALSGDAFFIKLDPLGNLIWALKTNGTSYEGGLDVSVDKYNDIYFVGTFLGTVDFDPGIGQSNLTSTGSSGDIYMLKLNSNGNFVWVTQIGDPSFFGSCMNMCFDKFNNIYSAGCFGNSASFQTDTNTIHLTSSGGYDIYLSKINQSNTINSVQEKANDVIFQIYPNPTNGILNIISNRLNAKLKVEVYNNLGSLIIEKMTAEKTGSIDLSGLSNGIYFIKVIADDQSLTTQKIVKQ